MEKLMSLVRAAVQKYDMIQPGDRVAVAVSGGKDSLFLLAALHALSGYYPKPFTLCAITVDPCFNDASTDFSQVQELCRRLSVPYIIRRTDLAKIIFEDRKEKNPCSLCARMRRGMLHDMALDLNCGKIALGHHGDDAAQTLMMNLLYGGKIGCFSPVTYLSRKELTMIRPLIFCDDRQVRAAAARMRLPVVKSACPADGATGRADTADLLDTLSQQFPDVKAKILGAMQRGKISGW